MKVLFLLHSCIVGGAEKSLLSLVSELIHRGHQCIIASPRSDLLKDVLSEQRVTYVKVSSLGNVERRLSLLYLAKTLTRIWAGALKIAQIVRREQVDVLHANSIACGIYGGLAGRLSGCRVVMHIRDMSESALTKRLVRWLVIRWVHKTIFVSHATARHYFPRGEENDKWMVIYNGIDQADFSAMAAQDEMYLRDRGLEVPAGCTIGMVGLLTPLKGYHVAIDAFAKVLASYPDTSLWIVGSGNDQGYQERLGEQVKELGLDGKVLFTGYVREVGAIIENLSMLVSASTGPDALPRVLLEGMALGIPIVASAIGGIPEQVEDRVNGYLFEPGDAGALAECICELLGDPERVAAMGQAGKEIVRERFSLRRHVDGVESVYASLAT